MSLPEPDLSTARSMIEAAVVHANVLGVRVSVAVVTSAGHEVITVRMDGASWFTAEIARSKARTAAALRRDTSEVAALGDAYPELLGLIGGQLPFEPVTLAGGVVNDDGAAWAVGVSGASPEQDVECARAAIAFAAGR